MKKLHKLFPPHLSQLVFMDTDGENLTKINSIDYDLFIWLIYNTHKKHKDDKSLIYDFEYIDIKKTFKKTMNTKVIRESLERIGKLLIISNYLQSYGNKEIIVTKPFEIEIVPTDKNISYGFNVKTTDEFMKWFDNPKPKVDVNYDIIYNLKPTMSKLLYLFLRDSYGGYTDTTRYRNVDIHRLRHMMNVYNEKTTNSNFITELKKSVETINKYSDLTVKFKVDKKRNLRSGISEITGVKFTIEWDENKLFEMRLKDRKSKKIDETKPDEVIINVETECSFEDYLTNLVEEEYEEQISNGIVIQNPNGYKNGIRKNLIKGGIEEEFKFIMMIETEKNILRKKITDNQPYKIIFKDDDNLYENYYINDNCLFVKSHDNTLVTKTINESIEFIHDNRMELYFDTVRCTESYKNVGRM